MKIFSCMIIGYLIGSLNPAALIGKIKKTDLHEHGTGNLGATNTALVFGKLFGALVMVFDIFKGVISYVIATLIVPGVKWVALLCGFSAVVGHCFPFYLKFKGGKGLAAFGGVILAHAPLFFLFALITGGLIVLAVNNSTPLPYYAGVLFPIHVALNSRDLPAFIVSVAMCALIMVMFIPNVKKALKGEDYKSREFLKTTKKSDSKEF